MEIGRPFQTFSTLATACRSRRVLRWTYWSHSGTRTARWLSSYGAMSMPGGEAVALQRRERAVVADEVRDRVGHRSPPASSYGQHRTGRVEGLLSAKVTEEWYWEPYEWEGMNEPVPGHGEKLVLYRVGTSGADHQDISWRREP